MVRNGKNGAKQLALIVDDDPDLLKSMVAQLTGMNFEVLDALHYDAAVLHLSSRQPHLVCLDVDLPRQSGYELCEYIRGPLGLMRVPILMMCESGYPEDMAHAEVAGANVFLKKPFTMPQLRSCVEALVEPGHRSVPHLRRLLVWR